MELNDAIKVQLGSLAQRKCDNGGFVCLIFNKILSCVRYESKVRATRTAMYKSTYKRENSSALPSVWQNLSVLKCSLMYLWLVVKSPKSICSCDKMGCGNILKPLIRYFLDKSR